MSKFLRVRNIACRRGDRRVFSGIDFELADGEILHLKGPNGSGKSTLMRAICGLLPATEGEILWCGVSCRKLGGEFFRNVCFVDHLNGISEDLSAIENLRFNSCLQGFPVSDQQAFDALQQFDLADDADIAVRRLSQGQKRRVCLARLLLTDSPLWLLDEAFIALDQDATAFLQRLIERHVERGGLVVLTTHQPLVLKGVLCKTLDLGLSLNALADV